MKHASQPTRHDRCPVRKVTAKGGGTAIPARPRLLGQLVAAAVAGAGGRAAVTIKLRIGLSDSIQTYLEVQLHVSHYPPLKTPYGHSASLKSI